MANRVRGARREEGEARAAGVQGGKRKISLEALADRELSAQGFNLEDTKLFTEKGLQRKAWREARQWPEICADDIPEQVLEYLFDQWVAQQLSGCRLTRPQRAVYELHLRGLSIAEIAAGTGQNRQQVSTMILLARKQARKRRPSNYDGLQEVYWQEVRRHIYRKPRHGWNR
jgi:DNA-directed RNA polymerase specialized sigma24 family protein